MKIPAPTQQRQVVPLRPPVPAPYLAMAAAHMQGLGKQVFDTSNETPNVAQLAAALKGPNASGQ